MKSRILFLIPLLLLSLAAYGDAIKAPTDVYVVNPPGAGAVNVQGAVSVDVSSGSLTVDNSAENAVPVQDAFVRTPAWQLWRLIIPAGSTGGSISPPIKPFPFDRFVIEDLSTVAYALPSWAGVLTWAKFSVDVGKAQYFPLPMIPGTAGTGTSPTTRAVAHHNVRLYLDPGRSPVLSAQISQASAADITVEFYATGYIISALSPSLAP